MPETTEEGKETIAPTNKVTDSDKESTESLEEKTLRESSQEVEVIFLIRASKRSHLISFHPLQI